MNFAAYSLAAAAFFVSIKPAPTNFFVLLTIILVVFGKETRLNLYNIVRHPVGWGSIVFFIFLCASQLHSTGTWEQGMDYIGKYARIAYIPFLAASLLSVADVRKVLWAFVFGIVLTVSFSYLNAFVPGFCNSIGLSGCGPANNPYIFKQHITHGFFVALGSGLLVFFASEARRESKPAWLVFLLYFLFVMSALNVLLMIDGRTGWLVFMVFPAVLLYRLIGVRGLVYSGFAGLFILLFMVLFVPQVQSMLLDAQREYNTWIASGGVSAGRSGMRLTYYSRAIGAIALQPWFGYGLGGVENALKLYGVAGGIFALNNPHNQYLLFTLQTGIFGLSLYFLYFGTLIRSMALGSSVAMAFLLAYAVGNLFNSFHFDMSEGILFAIGIAAFFGLHRVQESPMMKGLF
jgi:O-antigen ligase